MTSDVYREDCNMLVLLGSKAIKAVTPSATAAVEAPEAGVRWWQGGSSSSSSRHVSHSGVEVPHLQWVIAVMITTKAQHNVTFNYPNSSTTTSCVLIATLFFDAKEEVRRDVQQPVP